MSKSPKSRKAKDDAPKEPERFTYAAIDDGWARGHRATKGQTFELTEVEAAYETNLARVEAKS